MITATDRDAGAASPSVGSHSRAGTDGVQGGAAGVARSDLEVAMLTGGGDKPYALGLAAALTNQGIRADFIGSDELDSPGLRDNPRIRFLNLRGGQAPDASRMRKMTRLGRYYLRLLAYALTARPRIFHILWHNKFELFDRTLLMAFYKLLGKRLVFTAHNINAGKRDGNDTWLNRVSLRCQYGLADRIFVHTELMKRELMADFDVRDSKIAVIPFGINKTLPDTGLTRGEARGRLGLSAGAKVALFFGNIAPYKGLEHLVAAMAEVIHGDADCRLVIAGRPKGCEEHWAQIRDQIARVGIQERVVEKIGYIPDADVEIYFKAADVLVLPYVHIFQSGVLFLAYNFGLPVIASDSGSMREDIVEGETGLVCRPQDERDLARAIESYFGSELFKQLETRRRNIQEFANERYSWDKVGAITARVYAELMGSRGNPPVVSAARQ